MRRMCAYCHNPICPMLVACSHVLDAPVILIQAMLSMVVCPFQTPFACFYVSLGIYTRQAKMRQNLLWKILLIVNYSYLGCTIKVMVVAYLLLAYNNIFTQIIFNKFTRSRLIKYFLSNVTRCLIICQDYP